MRSVPVSLLLILFCLVGGAPAAAEPTPTPSPSPTAPPPVVPTVEAADIAVDPGYWQGTTERFALRITIGNPSDEDAITTTDVILPPDVTRVDATPAAGCTVAGLSFTCPLAAGAKVALEVTVGIASGAWRQPQRGRVRTTARVVGDLTPGVAEDTYAVSFPPGPPTPGIGLEVNDPVLRENGRDTVELEVRLHNSGAVPARGVVEVRPPAGVSVATVPSVCTARDRTVSGERCELGRIPADQQLLLVFGLTVPAAARSAAELLGSVQATLTPAVQDGLTVQSEFHIRIPEPAASVTPGDEGDGPVAAAAEGARGANRLPDSGPIATAPVSRTLSIIPLLTAVAGAFTILVVLSLIRRRSG
ncbi:hypothetical protein Val02_54370 [Virgisporangium aliadipatigenens]|uniref:DUF11 domain-containing protein n=2 Tax=Virgisporangium aliadipatigenens TaxID=741659 RepID=A0A8J4DSV6_9ACTN|nr:hypothetical protein Val02_54370 [Virgisporangium aliadipatigenens]